MQNPNSLFNEAFYYLNSNIINGVEEDYYGLIEKGINFNKDKRFKHQATRENYKKAILLFEEFLRFKPTCKFAYNYCGIARANIDDFQGAIADFTKSIELHPKFAVGFYNRGYTQFILKEYEEAIKDISIAITLRKNNELDYEIRGAAKKNSYDFKGAKEDLSKCIAINPANFRAILLRASVYLSLDNYKKAVVEFNKVYKNDPGNFGDYFSRGRAYFGLKKYNKAIEDFEIAAQKYPDSSTINSKLKEARIKQYIEEQSLLEVNLPSKKELIIKAFSTMDISLLEVLLEDYKTYQDAPKDVFIQKLTILFKQFKEEKNTILVPYEGKCNGKGCDNKGCGGYSFIGNVSQSYIDLIFEETENNYKDICTCHGFKNKEKNITKISRLSIDVKIDEKAHFSPSPAEAIIHQDCIAAYNKIVKSKQQLLTNKFLISWLKTNRNLYDQISEDIDYSWFPHQSVDNFKALFVVIDNTIQLLDFEIAVFEAIEDYNKLDIAIEPVLLKWLVTYEELYNKVKNLIYSVNSEITNSEFDPELRKALKYVALNCKITKRFKKTYKKFYYPMLEKYQIREVGVSIEMNPNSEEYINFLSLKYNLEKSGIKLN